MISSVLPRSVLFNSIHARRFYAIRSDPMYRDCYYDNHRSDSAHRAVSADSVAMISRTSGPGSKGSRYVRISTVSCCVVCSVYDVIPVERTGKAFRLIERILALELTILISSPFDYQS